MIDIDNNPKAKNSISYARALRLINIQTTSTTAAIISKEKISSSKQLEDNLKVKMDKYNELSTKYQEVNRKIKLLNAQIRATGQYWAYKDIYAKYMAQPKAKKEAFFEQHRAELTLYLDASSELKKLTNGHAKLPTVKMLRSQVAELKDSKNKLYEAQSAAKKDYIYAQTLLSNVKGKSIEKHNTKKHSIDDD